MFCFERESDPDDVSVIPDYEADYQEDEQEQEGETPLVVFLWSAQTVEDHCVVVERFVLVGEGFADDVERWRVKLVVE